MKKYIYWILIITLISCKEEQTKINAHEIIVSTETSADRLLTSEFIDSSYFIRLETNDDCLLIEIHKIVFDEQRIFIFDPTGNNKILIFDNTGKFINVVGNIGSGPGEYIQLYDFCIDNVTRQLFLLCDRDIIMRYDYTGQFKEKHKVDFMSVKIEYFDDHFYFITEQIDFFNLIITDNKFKITQKLFPDKDFGKNRVRLLHPLKVDFNGVQYRRYMDNCIYRIKNHKDVIRQYEVDFGNKSVAFSELKKLDPNILNEKRITSRGELYSFTQNDETAIFYYGDNDESVIGFYDKKSRVAKNYFLHNIYDKYLENYYPLFFRYLTTNNEFVSEVYPAILFQNQTKNIIEKLNLSEDDNPVLYVVKMK